MIASLVLCLGVALGAEGFAPREALYPGTLRSPPVEHWRRALPGDTLNAATHTERGRPVLHGELVLVGSAAGQGLYSLSRRDGGLTHIFSAAASVESEPLVVGERVFFSDTGGFTWCYDLDGTLVWSHDSKAPVLVRPTVFEGVVYLTNVDDLAYALDADTGTLNWQHKAKRDLTRKAELALYAAPPAVVVDDLVLVGFSDGALVALQRETGEVQWRKRVGEGRYPDLVARPVVVGTDVFASGYYEPLVAIDLASQNVRWRIDVGAAAPVAVDQSAGTTTLFHPGTDGILRGVVALTGAQTWTWDSGTGSALSEPVLTEAGLLVGSTDGGLVMLDPSDGRLLWTYLGDTMLRGVTVAPALEGRQLVFVTNGGQIISMLVPEARTAWPPQ